MSCYYCHFPLVGCFLLWYILFVRSARLSACTWSTEHANSSFISGVLSFILFKRVATTVSHHSSLLLLYYCSNNNLSYESKVLGSKISNTLIYSRFNAAKKPFRMSPLTRMYSIGLIR